MAMAFEVLGISPAGFSMVPAVRCHKADVARRTGELVLEVLRKGLKPSDIITRQSLENAIAAIAMSGGSTQRRPAPPGRGSGDGDPLDIDDFDKISAPHARCSVT